MPVPAQSGPINFQAPPDFACHLFGTLREIMWALRRHPTFHVFGHVPCSSGKISYEQQKWLVGHDLGDAVCDSLLDAYVKRGSKSTNPWVSVKRATFASKNRRYYL